MYKQFLMYGKKALNNKIPQRIVLENYLKAKPELNSAVSDPKTIEKVQNTLNLFKAAAETNGLERRCLETIVYVQWSKHARTRHYKPKSNEENIVYFNDDFYNDILANINKTMNTCL